MGGICVVTGHLYGGYALIVQVLGEAGKKPFVVAQPMEGGVGKDDVDRARRLPAGDFPQDPVDPVVLGRLGQHRRRRVESVHRGLRPAPGQERRNRPGPASQIPDLGRRTAGDSPDQIERRPHAMVGEQKVLIGIPARHAVGAVVMGSPLSVGSPTCGRRPRVPRRLRCRPKVRSR